LFDALAIAVGGLPGDLFVSKRKEIGWWVEEGVTSRSLSSPSEIAGANILGDRWAGVIRCDGKKMPCMYAFQKLVSPAAVNSLTRHDLTKSLEGPVNP
jgi:hypothetical protein